MTTFQLAALALDGLTYNNAKVPLAEISYGGTLKTYLRYYTYLNTPQYFADDFTQAEGDFGTIDIFSDQRNALVELLPQIKQRLRDGHFTIGDTGPQQFENDTKMYHLPINIYHESEV